MADQLMPKGTITPLYDVEDKPPLKEAIPLGMQHVLAMFAGNVAVPIIIAGLVPLPVEQKAFLISCAMFVAGIATFFQVEPIGPIGAKLPIVMGTSFGFLPTSIAIVKGYGLPALFGAAFVGGFFEIIIGFFLKTIRKYFPPVVTGTVVLTIGLSLLPTGINYFAGGVGAPDFGSPVNLFLGTLVLLTVIIVQAWGKGIFGASAVLIGIIVGYIASIFVGKINFQSVAEASWFSVPMPLQFGIEFTWPAIAAMLIMYIVTAVETVGDISGITMGGAGREATDKELSGGVIADGFFSSFAAIFNALPNTSYSQNVGLVSMTGVMSRHVVKIGAIFLIVAGLFPKLGAVIAVMPASVLGGAAVPMFAFIATSGMVLIARGGLTKRNLLIVAISLGLGLGLSSVPDALKYFPESVKLLFSGSGIVIAALVALFMNLVLPQDEKVTSNQTQTSQSVND